MSIVAKRSPILATAEHLLSGPPTLQMLPPPMTDIIKCDQYPLNVVLLEEVDM